VLILGVSPKRGPASAGNHADVTQVVK
jgi:hypothetical protein